MKNTTLICAIGLVSACSSSGGVDSTQDRAATATALAASLAQDNFSNPDTLPTRGGATYAGFMTLALPLGAAAQDVVGDMTLAVDFGVKRDQVTGTASNFEGLSGSLDIAGGDLNRNADPDVDFTFGGDVTGTLSQSGDSYLIDANLEGDFRGRNYDGVTGLIYGDISGPAGQDIFQGSIAGSRTN